MNTITTPVRRDIESVRPHPTKAAEPARKATLTPTPVLDADLVRARAYEIFSARSGAPGDQVADWLQAERELRARAARETGSPRATPRASRGEILLSDED